MRAKEFVTEKQDACYHKVKSRYKVWPSAYASGALSKCRKVGAKNRGNKSKNLRCQALDNAVAVSTHKQIATTLHLLIRNWLSKSVQMGCLSV